MRVSSSTWPPSIRGARAASLLPAFSLVRGDGPPYRSGRPEANYVLKPMRWGRWGPKRRVDAQSTHSKSSATGAGVAALQATPSPSLAALDKRPVADFSTAVGALDVIDDALFKASCTLSIMDGICADDGHDTGRMGSYRAAGCNRLRASPRPRAFAKPSRPGYVAAARPSWHATSRHHGSGEPRSPRS